MGIDIIRSFVFFSYDVGKQSSRTSPPNLNNLRFLLPQCFSVQIVPVGTLALEEMSQDGHIFFQYHQQLKEDINQQSFYNEYYHSSNRAVGSFLYFRVLILFFNSRYDINYLFTKHQHFLVGFRSRLQCILKNICRVLLSLRIYLIYCFPKILSLFLLLFYPIFILLRASAIINFILLLIDSDCIYLAFLKSFVLLFAGGTDNFTLLLIDAASLFRGILVKRHYQIRQEVINKYLISINLKNQIYMRKTEFKIYQESIKDNDFIFASIRILYFFYTFKSKFSNSRSPHSIFVPRFQYWQLQKSSNQYFVIKFQTPFSSFYICFEDKIIPKLLRAFSAKHIQLSMSQGSFQMTQYSKLQLKDTPL